MADSNVPLGDSPTPTEPLAPSVPDLSSARQAKALTTNEAMQTLTLGGFGLAGGGITVFGGVFIWLGLAWTLVCVAGIFLLYRDELAEVVKKRHPTRHLILPACVVTAVPLLTLAMASKNQILNWTAQPMLQPPNSPATRNPEFSPIRKSPEHHAENRLADDETSRQKHKTPPLHPFHTSAPKLTISQHSEPVAPAEDLNQAPLPLIEPVKWPDHYETMGTGQLHSAIWSTCREGARESMHVMDSPPIDGAWRGPTPPSQEQLNEQASYVDQARKVGRLAMQERFRKEYYPAINGIYISSLKIARTLSGFPTILMNEDARETLSTGTPPNAKAVDSLCESVESLVDNTDRMSHPMP